MAAGAGAFLLIGGAFCYVVAVTITTTAAIASSHARALRPHAFLKGRCVGAASVVGPPSHGVADVACAANSIAAFQKAKDGSKFVAVVVGRFQSADGFVYAGKHVGELHLVPVTTGASVRNKCNIVQRWGERTFLAAPADSVHEECAKYVANELEEQNLALLTVTIEKVAQTVAAVEFAHIAGGCAALRLFLLSAENAAALVSTEKVERKLVKKDTIAADLALIQEWRTMLERACEELGGKEVRFC
jgi:hypothetical protein